MNKRNLLTAGLLTAAATMAGIMAYASLSPIPKPVQKNTIRPVVSAPLNEDLTSIVQRHGKIQFEKPVDEKKPVLLYISQAHNMPGPERELAVKSQASIYLLLKDLLEKRKIDAAYFEGFSGKAKDPPEHARNLKKTILQFNKQDAENFFSNNPNTQAYNLLKIAGFENVFGYFAQETKTLMEEAPPRTIQEIDGRIQAAMRKGTITTTYDEVSKIAEAYRKFMDTYDRNTQDSISNSRRIANSHGHRNIAIIAGASHADDARRYGKDFETASSEYNFGFVQTVQFPRLDNERESIRTNLRLFLRFKQKMKDLGITEGTFNVEQ